LECVAASGILNDKIPIGVLTETDLDLALAFAKFIQAKSIHPFSFIDKRKHRANARIAGFPWTINE
jgi:glycerophosphoryl diester phosphodiesterase